MKHLFTLICCTFIISVTHSCNILSGKIESMQFDVDTLHLVTGTKDTLNLSILPKSAQTDKIIWISENPLCIGLDKGIVSAITEGTSKIRAIALDSGAEASCIVRSYIPFILLDPPTSIRVSERYVVHSRYNAPSYKPVWESSDTSIVSVDSNGVLRGKAEGSVTITAKDRLTGFLISFSLNVYQDQLSTALDIEKDLICLFTGTHDYEIQRRIENQGTLCHVLWESADETVATVSAKGLLSAISQGDVMIYGTTSDSGIKDSCLVKVRDCPEDAIWMGGLIAWATCNIDASSPDEAGGLYAWGETETKQEYTLENYRHAISGGFSTSTYGSETLRIEDDRARNALGGFWRTPTIFDWDELNRFCNISEDTVNGMRGFTFTCNHFDYKNESLRKKGSNTLFIPFGSDGSIIYMTANAISWASGVRTFRTTTSYYNPQLGHGAPEKGYAIRAVWDPFQTAE